jgi:hypothetical protein
MLGVLAVFGALATCSLSAGEWKTLPGHVPRELSKLPVIGRLPATNQMRLAIGLPLRDPAGLSNFLAEVYNPASPNYRHFLTAAQLTARFGPTEQDYEAVKQFARTNGLTVAATFGNRLVVDVTGPAAAVEKAWHIALHTYQHPTEARQFFAPDTEPTVAAGLPVVDVQGLSDFIRPHSKIKRTDLARQVAKNGSAPGGSGAFFGDDFRNAYASGTTLTGAGQMVGLLQFDGFYSNDIVAYATAAGGGRASIPVQTVLLDGYDGIPISSDGNTEVSLDIEMSMSMAPGLARIIVFEAGLNGSPNDILNSMLTYSNTVHQLSCSWGWGGGPSATTETIFQLMDAAGQSFFNASGDGDAFTSGAGSVNGVDNPSLPNAPSSSPNITHVGGTTLTMNGSGSSYASETVWNWGVEYGSANDGQGSSGGISSYYPIPWWQTNVTDMASRGGSTTNRNIPDVALTADNVYVIAGGNQAVENVGGTSCASPLWAGFMALVNQQAAAGGGQSPGFINPAIYAIAAGSDYAACFHDVTTGNNTWSGSPSLFYAMNGYDLCTGLGTPNGVALINALQADTMGVIATGSYSFSGPFGGPFTPGSCTFELTNTTAVALDWSAANSAAWLTLNATAGTLPAHSAANVVASLTAMSSNYVAGAYSTAIVFSNETTQVLHRMPATLRVEEALSVSPTKGFTGSGPAGGPFVSASQTYVLTNLGGGTLNWVAINNCVWLSASPGIGSLGAGGSATVTVTPSVAATTLAPGEYQASLEFADQGGVVATVPFELSVGQLVVNGGFESGDFTGWIQSGNTNYTFVTNAACNFVHLGTCGAVLGATPSQGSLSQNLPTSPGKNYALSFWLRNPTGGSLHKVGPNLFQARWNGGLILAQTNITSSAWNEWQFTVTATNLVTPLQFFFEDDPAFLALDDVSVTELTPATNSTTAAVSSFVLTAPNRLEMTWKTTSGTAYQLQYTTNLCQPDWINLGAAVTAGAGTLTLADTNTAWAAPSRFYRLSPAQ